MNTYLFTETNPQHSQELLHAIDLLEATFNPVRLNEDEDEIVVGTQTWLILEPSGGDFSFVERMIEEYEGLVGRITVVAPQIPKLLVGSCDQVSSWSALRRRYFFV